MPKGRNPGRGKGKPAPKSPASGNDPDAFMRDLIRRMDGCDTAEKLNDEVLMPFALALEKVCGARGYVMNIYGETSNIVFSGNTEDTEAIYQIVEAYMDDQADDD
ncbi:MAG: hypothetical protein JJ855_00905 [Rhodospirillales bacterium]|nr:hypothetical protein [Rhodospirillales bacterium]